MKTIYKTWKKATYFKGNFQLRDEDDNMAWPIEFPTVFTAYGQGIASGNWQSCTRINTPKYVIDNYFDTIGHNKHDAMFQMWAYCKQLDTLNHWDVVKQNKDELLRLINLANNELLKLKTF